MNRRQMLALTAGAVAAPGIGFAQSSRQRLVASIIGARNPPNETSFLWANAVRMGLANEGWIDGGNTRFEVRFTAGLPELTERFADELVAMQPDVYVTGTTANALAIQERDPSAPRVFVAVPDPVGAGLVEAFARPGGNATGIVHLEPTVGGRMVETLIQIAPETTQIVSLTNPDTLETTGAVAPAEPGASSSPNMVRFMREASIAHGRFFSSVDVRLLEDVRPAVEAIAAMPGSGLALPTNNWVHNNAATFVDAINSHQVPAIYPATRMVDAGGLIGIGTATFEMFRLGGSYAGRILNGVSPADLPVQSAPFQMVVNLQTASQQGLEVPVEILATADRVIE